LGRLKKGISALFSKSIGSDGIMEATFSRQDDRVCVLFRRYLKSPPSQPKPVEYNPISGLASSILQNHALGGTTQNSSSVTQTFLERLPLLLTSPIVGDLSSNQVITATSTGEIKWENQPTLEVYLSDGQLSSSCGEDVFVERLDFSFSENGTLEICYFKKNQEESYDSFYTPSIKALWSEIDHIIAYLFLNFKTSMPFFLRNLYSLAKEKGSYFREFEGKEDLAVLNEFKIYSDTIRFKSPFIKEILSTIDEEQVSRIANNLPNRSILPQTFSEIITERFGKVSSTLANAIRQTVLLKNEITMNVSCLDTLPIVYKMLGYDYFYQFLGRYNWDVKQEDREGISFINWESIAFQAHGDKIVKLITPKKLVNCLLKGSLTSNLEYLRDGLNMYLAYDSVEKIPNTLKDSFPSGISLDFNFGTIKEWHDKISDQHILIKAEEKSRPIPIHPSLHGLTAYQDKGYRAEFASHTKDLIVWGKKLDICIGSYDDKAIKGESVLGAIYHKNELVACFEMRGQRMAYVDTSGLPWDPAILEAKSDGDIFDVQSNKMKETLSILPVVSDWTKDGVDHGLLIRSIVQIKGKRNKAPELKEQEFLMEALSHWIENGGQVARTSLRSDNRDRTIDGMVLDAINYNYQIGDLVTQNPHGLYTTTYYQNAANE